MQRYFRERGCPRCSQSFKNGMVIASGITVVFSLWFIFGFTPDIGVWYKYQQAKLDARTFRSTMCRIENIIVEETRSDHNSTEKATSAKGFFILRVINSTNEQDQFKIAKVPLVHQPEQLSLVNSSLACFYDPAGVQQARLTLANLSEAKKSFQLWCAAPFLFSGTFILSFCFDIIPSWSRIRQWIRSRHQTADLIPMQPINFA